MDLFSSVLGPLDKKFCVYFAVMAIFSLVMLFAAILTILVSIFKIKFSDMSFVTLFNLIFMGLSIPLLYLFVYIQNRLLYQMCLHS